MDIYQISTLQDYLLGNSYVGRGIVIGRSADGRRAVFAYFIMGRSENSRNRVFEEKDGTLLIRPFDPSKVSDPSLILYTPVRPQGDRIVVTNGDQTDTICDYLKADKTFEQALETRCFEPDAPNYTPRVSGMLCFLCSGFRYKLNILKSLDAEGTACTRQTFAYLGQPGLGHILHTYACDGEPLPSFRGEPARVKIPDDIDALTGELWDALDTENKISLYVRYTDLETLEAESRLINRHL